MSFDFFCLFLLPTSVILHKFVKLSRLKCDFFFFLCSNDTLLGNNTFYGENVYNKLPFRFNGLLLCTFTCLILEKVFPIAVLLNEKDWKYVILIIMIIKNNKK